MGDILAKSLGFILIIITAYTLKQFGVIKLEDKKFLGTMILTVNLPCVIISGFQDFQYDTSLVVAVILALVANFIGIAIGYVISLKKDKETRILFMMGTSGYNIGIFVIPFVSSFLSSAAVVCSLMFDIGNAIIVFGTSAAITSAVVNNQKSNPIPAILKKLFTTVPFITYIVMIAVVSLNITLPSRLYIMTDIGANATAFLAMFMIGVMLEFNIKKDDFKSAISVIITRYLYSAIVSVFIYMLPFDLEIRKALIIAVFSPLSTAGVVFTEKIGCKSSLVGVFGTLNIICSMIAIIGIVIFL